MIAVEFLLFGLTLAGVALLHQRALGVALTGLAAIIAWKLLGPGFDTGPGLAGLLAHLGHEWVVLCNLFALLVGFALVARHFSASGVPDLLPAILPDDWTGALSLLAIVFLVSGFLDNIAAAIIGATIAGSLFRGRVHIGYLAAIVAAANAGGAGSVIGDTTTTMMWIQGVPAAQVLPAYVGSIAAFLVFAIPAARWQQAYSPIQKNPPPSVALDRGRAFVVATVLATAVATNILVRTLYPESADSFPFIGAAVAISLLATAAFRAPDWKAIPAAARGSLFLLALVTCASLMPVSQLPDASPAVTLGLGFVSAMFDNIPLTKLALEQGGYDWAALAYAVGFGGSMIWFGSSAGVAVASQFPQAREARLWLRHGWPIVLAYPLGFIVMMALIGWNPIPH